MSRLLKSAVKFDKTPCQDAYTGSFSFNGQLKAWPESTRDSEVSQRRVLSTGPDVVIPARRAINAFGEVYIVGTGHLDTFKGAPIRRGYTSSLADGLARVQTLEQACLGLPGLSAYAGKAWVKNEAYTQQDSKLNQQYQVFFSTSEPIPNGSVITLNGVVVLSRLTFDAPSGLRVAVSDQVQAPREPSASLESRVFDPVTNSSDPTTTIVPVLRIRWQSLFSYGQDSAPNFEAGDLQVVIAKSSGTPVPGCELMLSDGRWCVLSVVSYGNVWLCRVNLAG